MKLIFENIIIHPYFLFDVFRILFSIILFLEFKKIFMRIEKRYVNVIINFKVFDFLPLLSSQKLKLISFLGIVHLLPFILGFQIQYCAAVIALSWGYFLFLDPSYYNNHYYLYFLLLILFSLLEPCGELSLNYLYYGKINAENIDQVFYLFQFQLGIVFFFAGVAKLKRGWISGRCLKEDYLYHIKLGYLSEGLGKVLMKKEVLILISLLGLFFDLILGLCLIWGYFNPLLVIGGLLFFSFFNLLTLKIGTFSFFLMSTIPIFLYGPNTTALLENIDFNIRFFFFAVYMFIQVVLPLKFLLTRSSREISSSDTLFSWAMKSTRKTGVIRFKVYLEGLDDVINVSASKYLNKNQRYFLSYSCKNIISLAKFIKADIEENKKIKVCRIVPESLLTVNNSKAFNFLKEVDLVGEVFKWPYTKIIRDNISVEYL